MLESSVSSTPNNDVPSFSTAVVRGREEGIEEENSSTIGE